MELGSKIKKIRTEKKLSMRQLAEKLDVSQAHISKMEKGENLPSLPLLQKMAEVFGVPMRDFFDIEHISSIGETSESEIRIGIDKNIKKDINEEDIKKALEFVKDLKSGKFDMDKLNDINL